MTNPLNITLRTAATQAEADEIVDLLAGHNIDAKITKDSGDLDAAIQGESPRNKFEIHIQEDQQVKAESILIEEAKKVLDQIPNDHYIYSFSDEELKNVLIEKNEWSEFDLLLSEKILKDRGVEIDFEDIEKQRLQRDTNLAKPEGGQVGWIVFGYIASVLGGFIGILLGYSLWKAKRKLPNGKKTPVYKDSVRSHGKNIFYLGVVIFTIFFFIRLIQMIG